MFMNKRMSAFLTIVIAAGLTLLNSCQKEPEPVIYNDYVVPYQIVEETFRLGARSTAFISNKSIITRTIKLPPRTVYWAYWMGAGPEPVDALAKIVLPAAAARLTKDPFVAYAWGIISALNLTEIGKSNADIFFMTKDQEPNFSFNNSDFQSFISKPQTKNIHDKYIDILDTPYDTDNTIVMGLRNQNYGAGVDVKVKVWAFVVKPL
ncbi:MAG: hypothetical protein EBV15_00730 [Bacteroidetes bacterium]|nr:hypothetical protein [Bacteroidota bacterium]